MGTKNNPENRGLVTELRTFEGKKVKPVLYVSGNRRYIAAAYESNGDLAVSKGAEDPVAYAACAVS
jgi:hypothetical protein